MTNETWKGLIYGVAIVALLWFAGRIAAPLYNDLVFLHQARLYTEAQAAQQRSAPPAAK